MKWLDLELRNSFKVAACARACECNIDEPSVCFTLGRRRKLERLHKLKQNSKHLQANKEIQGG